MTVEAEAKTKDSKEVEIIKKIIQCCSKSLETDVLLGRVLCGCGKAIPGTQADLWKPIGRSDTYWIRNTLQSMLDCGWLKRPAEPTENRE